MIKGDQQLSLVLHEDGILPARHVRRRRAPGNGKNTKGRAMNVKRMHHSYRKDLPNFGASEFHLRIGEVVSLSIDTNEASRGRVRSG